MWFLGNIGYQGQNAIFGALYAHKGRTKKLKRHGLHGFALDQSSINGIGPINRSEKMKRSEMVGNMIRPKLVQPAFLKKNISAQRKFFFWRSKGVQGETVGNSRRSHLRSAKKTCFYIIFKHVSWTYATKQLLFCRAKVRSPTVSNRFPLDTFGLSKKKLRCADFFFRNAGWTSFGLIMFPTISDRFRPFHFFWTINWSNSIYGRLIQSKSVQTMMLKFFRATLVRVHCTKYCILTLISNIP